MSRSLARLLLITAALSFIGMYAFQWAKHLVMPGITIWESHLLTNLFIALIFTLAIYLGVRASDRLDKAITGEADERKRLEVRLDEVNRQLSEQVREQTSELSRLNFELELEMAEHKHAKSILAIGEERFRNMADNIQEGLTIIENGAVVFANQRACEIFGIIPTGEHQFISTDFAVPEEREDLRRVIEEAVRTADYPAELRYWILRQDGTRRCVLDRYAYSHKEGVMRSFIITSDITERLQAYQMLEQAVEERTRELSTVLEVSQKVTSTLELEPLLRLVLDQIQTVIPLRGAAIFTLEDDVLKVMTYKVPGFPESTSTLHLTLANSEICRQVIETRSVLIIDDVQDNSPLLQAFQESVSQEKPKTYSNVRSWIGIPLIIKDRVLGLLSLTHSLPNYYTQRHARLALIIANQVAVAMENARLYEQAFDLATLEERQRIARELHDSVTQLLYGISLYSTAANRSLQGQDFEQAGQHINEIKNNALQAQQEMRLLIFELHPPGLKEEGLVAALQTSLEAMEARTELQTELQVDGINRLPGLIEGELFRIAMEALNNLVKYARAQKVTVSLKPVNGAIAMEICDNGVGFDLEAARACGGLGLRNMEERTLRLGGSFEITSTLGTGTRVSLQVPIQEDEQRQVRILTGIKVTSLR